jgi:hypothetical protein
VIDPPLRDWWGAGRDRAWEQPGIKAIKEEELRRAPLVCHRHLPNFQFLWPFRPIGVIPWCADHMLLLHCRQVAGVVTSCKPNGLGDLLVTLKVSIGQRYLASLFSLYCLSVFNNLFNACAISTAKEFYVT